MQSKKNQTSLRLIASRTCLLARSPLARIQAPFTVQIDRATRILQVSETLPARPSCREESKSLPGSHAHPNSISDQLGVRHNRELFRRDWQQCTVSAKEAL